MKTKFLDKLAALMKEKGLDAVLVCPSEELTFIAAGGWQRFAYEVCQHS